MPRYAPNKGKSIYQRTEELADKIKSLRSQGERTSKIAEEIGWPYHATHSYMKDLGIDLKKRPSKSNELSSSSRRQKHGWLGEDLMRQHYIDEEMSIHAIAKKYNRSPGSIWNELLTYESIPRRSKQENAEKVLRQNPDIPERQRQLCMEGKIGIWATSYDGRETWIEKAFIDWAAENDISIKPQYPIVESGHRYDFLIEGTNILVETDGAYWHNTKAQRRKDKEQVDIANEMGYIVLRFTDNQIRETKSSCFNVIKEYLND